MPRLCRGERSTGRPLKKAAAVPETFREVQEALKTGKDGKDGMVGRDDVEVAKNLWSALMRMTGKLTTLSVKAGVGAYAKFGDSYPVVAWTLDAGFRSMKEVAMKSGPEAKRIYDETTQQVRTA